MGVIDEYQMQKEIDRLRDENKVFRVDNARLREMVAKLDGQLGKRPCQMDRCIQHAKLSAENKALREALLDMTTWAKDIAGDCIDRQQRVDELNMLRRATDALRGGVE